MEGKTYYIRQITETDKSGMAHYDLMLEENGFDAERVARTYAKDELTAIRQLMNDAEAELIHWKTRKQVLKQLEKKHTKKK